MKSDEDLSRVMDTYADMVRRICFVHLKNKDDTEDIFQNVYLKYLLHEKAFESDEHEKAWFARVTINACTDHLRYLSRSRDCKDTWTKREYNLYMAYEGKRTAA